jgi:peptidoglycan/xylan/chitin deacetylase (PgdA/CDA1 family)
MAFGHWITLRDKLLQKNTVFAILIIALQAINTPARAQIAIKNECSKPLYLTFDTGHMEVAPFIADVLNKHQVKVTFFAANERTKVGDGRVNGSLSQYWAPWWKARAAEGHEFASHTYDHVYWRGDLPSTSSGLAQFRIKPSAGAFEGREFTYDAKKYCEQIAFAAERLQDFTGKKPLPLFRAPGGKASPKLLATAKSCGFEHVGWAPAGFLGDELPSGSYPNETLLKKALNNIKSGDILMAHLGIWSRQDPWAPAVLEPLIVGLKTKGFCFQTLREHPQYKEHIAADSKASTAGAK